MKTLTYNSEKQEWIESDDGLDQEVLSNDWHLKVLRKKRQGEVKKQKKKNTKKKKKKKKKRRGVERRKRNKIRVMLVVLDWLLGIAGRMHVCVRRYVSAI